MRVPTRLLHTHTYGKASFGFLWSRLNGQESNRGELRSRGHRTQSIPIRDGSKEVSLGFFDSHRASGDVCLLFAVSNIVFLQFSACLFGSGMQESGRFDMVFRPLPRKTELVIDPCQRRRNTRPSDLEAVHNIPTDQGKTHEHGYCCRHAQ